MEGRIHTSGAHSTDGNTSRMKEDLRSCYHDMQFCFQPRTAIRKRGPVPHVGVIGAGLAGLRCAEILAQGGAKVTILEGRDRIGGRIYQCKLDGHLLDMGPNWVHGTDDNPIVRLAKETETKLCRVDESVSVFDPAGVSMGEEEVKEGFDVMWSLVEDAFRYSNESCLDIPPDLSLKDFFTEKLATLRLPPEQKNQILLLAEVWGSFIGDSWERQSLRWFWMEECLDGENLFVADTHGPIIARIAEKALAHATLHLSTIVTSIESTTNPVGDPRVAIKTANNGHFEFDEVVVTVPLGCLKRSTPVFSPPLPPRITRAIHNASYCSLDKVYLTFPRAFWDGPAPAPSNPQDPTPSTPLPPFVHFLHPTTYIPSPAAACTLEMAPLSSPTAFGPRHAQPTLLFYTYGPCTEHLSALVRGLPRSSPDYLAALAGFLRPFYSRLRHYDAADAACAPTGAVFSDFRADALAGNGCYTNFQVGAAVAPGAAGEGEAGGQVLLDEDVRAMRAGVPGCGVWLAGEHVAPFVGLGTTTGAYWSGEAAGMRVLAAHGMVKGGARESSEASETESGAGEREK